MASASTAANGARPSARAQKTSVNAITAPVKPPIVAIFQEPFMRQTWWSNSDGRVSSDLLVNRRCAKTPRCHMDKISRGAADDAVQIRDCERMRENSLHRISCGLAELHALRPTRSLLATWRLGGASARRDGQRLSAQVPGVWFVPLVLVLFGFG